MTVSHAGRLIVISLAVCLMQIDEPAGAESLFAVLNNCRRRILIRLLNDTDSLCLREAAEIIAAKENTLDRSEVTTDQRNSVYVVLYQTHAPTMDAANVATYDAQAKSLCPGEDWQLTYDILYWTDYKLST